MGQLLEVWLQVEDDAPHGARQCDASDEEHSEDDVREDGGEDDSLAHGLDAFEQAHEAREPRHAKTDNQGPLHASRLMNTTRHV